MDEMPSGVEIWLGAVDRERLEADVADPTSPEEQVWWARIVLATAEAAARRRSCPGPSTTLRARRQRRFLEAEVDGLLHDKTRRPDFGVLVAAVVVEDHVDRPAGRSFTIDRTCARVRRGRVPAFAVS